jgi:5-methylcytosine-specific restriction enzyme A
MVATEGLRRLANQLWSSGTTDTAAAAPEEGETEVDEGRIAFRMHRERERNSGLGRRKKRAVLQSTGRLACEVCGFDFFDTYGELGHGCIEAHHVVLLAESTGPIKVTTSALALVCSNCHRMLHHARPWLYPRQLRDRLNRLED